jgi:Fe-S cluster assembly iron-binding protein IscA
LLVITEAAAQAINDITTSLPEVNGLRLEVGADTCSNGSAPHFVVAVSAVSEPDELDQVIEEGGAHVFIDAPLTDYLDDKVLDVDVDHQGAAAFTLSKKQS